MNNNTFDEGIIPGGIRNKNDIRTLICYLLCAVGQPMSKDLILTSLQKKGLVNYFEASVCFDDLLKFQNIELIDEKGNLYRTTQNGKMICDQLETALPLTVRERAYNCALSLIEQQRSEKENIVKIEETSHGFSINCTIADSEIELLSLKLYVPDKNHGRIIKKNFQEQPELIYRSVIALLTRDKEYIKEILNGML